MRNAYSSLFNAPVTSRNAQVVLRMRNHGFSSSIKQKLFAFPKRSSKLNSIYIPLSKRDTKTVYSGFSYKYFYKKFEIFQQKQAYISLFKSSNISNPINKFSDVGYSTIFRKRELFYKRRRRTFLLGYYNFLGAFKSKLRYYKIGVSFFKRYIKLIRCRTIYSAKREQFLKRRYEKNKSSLRLYSSLSFRLYRRYFKLLFRRKTAGGKIKKKAKVKKVKNKLRNRSSNIKKKKHNKKSVKRVVKKKKLGIIRRGKKKVAIRFKKNRKLALITRRFLKKFVFSRIRPKNLVKRTKLHLLRRVFSYSSSVFTRKRRRTRFSKGKRLFLVHVIKKSCKKGRSYYYKTTIINRFFQNTRRSRFKVKTLQKQRGSRPNHGSLSRYSLLTKMFKIVLLSKIMRKTAFIKLSAFRLVGSIFRFAKRYLSQNLVSFSNWKDRQVGRSLAVNRLQSSTSFFRFFFRFLWPICSSVFSAHSIFNHTKILGGGLTSSPSRVRRNKFFESFVRNFDGLKAINTTRFSALSSVRRRIFSRLFYISTFYFLSLRASAFPKAVKVYYKIRKKYFSMLQSKYLFGYLPYVHSFFFGRVRYLGLVSHVSLDNYERYAGAVNGRVSGKLGLHMKLKISRII